VPASDDGALTESQGVNAGVDQGPQPATNQAPPPAPAPAGGEGASVDEPAPDAENARVEPDGTSQGGLLSQSNQHDGGPGQEYAVGEG
jgi:hypothetical protein